MLDSKAEEIHKISLEHLIVLRTHTSTHAHTCTHPLAHTYTHVFTYICTHAHAQTCMHTHTHTHLHTDTCTCTHTHLHTLQGNVKQTRSQLKDCPVSKVEQLELQNREIQDYHSKYTVVISPY